MTQSSQCAPSSLTDFGASLRKAREDAGMSLADVSSRVKTPARILAALEAGDTALLGAPVFVLGQLRSYAKLLGLTIPADILEVTTPVPAEPPVLVSHVHTPRYRRVAEHLGRRAIYVVLTASLVAPVWLATRPQPAADGATLESLDLPAETSSSAPAAQAQAPVRTPVVASMTAISNTPAAISPIELRFVGDSWFEVRARDGHLLEQALVTAGQARSIDPRVAARIVLGNSAAVTAQQAGRGIDLDAFSRANVARFALSSDGSVAPVAD